MMIMLRIPENKHRVQLRGSYRAVLLSCCHQHTVLAGRGGLESSAKTETKPQGVGKAVFQQKWGTVAFLWVFFTRSVTPVRERLVTA